MGILACRFGFSGQKYMEICCNYPFNVKSQRKAPRLLYILLVLSCLKLNGIMLQYFVLQSLTIAEAAYEINWMMLDSSSIKLLLVLMTRASRPMEFTIGYFVPLNTETFLKVKLFYRVYHSPYHYHNRCHKLRNFYYIP